MRRANYEASLRLEGLSAEPGAATKPLASRQEVVESYRKQISMGESPELAGNNWQAREIEQATGEAEAGDFATPEEVDAVLFKWGVNRD